MSRKMLISPSRTNCAVVPMALGRRATMPAMMISEMPLPMPRSVICSPIHMRNIVPAVSVITVISDERGAGIVNDAAAAGRGRFFERDGEHRALEQRQRHRAVAGVLGYFAAAGLAFLVELVEIGRGDFQADRERWRPRCTA